MQRMRSEILTPGTADPTAHEIVRTACLVKMFPERPVESWCFSRPAIEFYGPFVTLCARGGGSYNVFYTQEATAELMALLRESHGLDPKQERVTLLAIPARWHSDRHWKRYAIDGFELIARPDDSGPDGAIVVLTREERGTLITAFDAVNKPDVPEPKRVSLPVVKDAAPPATPEPPKEPTKAPDPA